MMFSDRALGATVNIIWFLIRVWYLGTMVMNDWSFVAMVISDWSLDPMMNYKQSVVGNSGE